MLLANLKPDHFLFSVIDGVVYFVVFLLLVVVLRQSLRLLAKEEADDSLGKCFLSTLLILVVSAFAATYVHAQALGYYMLIPVAIIAMLLIRLLCWVSFLKAVPIMLIFGLAAAGLNLGFMAGLNRILPENRTTLSKRIQISLGLLDELAGKESDPFFTKKNLKTIKSGWRLETEALKSAVFLIKDPKAIEKMVAQHQDDLRKLDLIVEGETNTIEQLAQIGIVYEANDPARRGIAVLQDASLKKEFTEQDVQDVALFLKSIRKDGSEVTATDVAIVIREAIKRAQTFQTNVVLGVRLGDFTNAPVPVAAAPVATITPEETPPPVSDPFAGLGAPERDAWNNSMTGLVVSSILRHHGNQVLAMVNGELIRTGETVSVASNGRQFQWRLVTIVNYQSAWEPVLKEIPRNREPGLISHL